MNGAMSKEEESLPLQIALTPEERGWAHRRFSIVHEVLGPDFHGPSSSHTAAPQLIALEAQRFLGGIPTYAKITLLNSFAATGEGHRTPIAVVAGLLGLNTTDPATPDALGLAAKAGFCPIFDAKEDPSEHPNTLGLELYREGIHLYVKGISIGGGNFELVEKKFLSALAA